MSRDAKPNVPGGNFSLWLGILGGPAAWLVALQVCYVLVPVACRSGHHLPLHLAGILFLCCGIFIGWIASRNLMAFIAQEGAGPDAVLAREHFMALLGVMMSALFSLVIFVQAAAAFIIGPCSG